MWESFSVNPHYGYGETEARPSLTALQSCTVVIICNRNSTSAYFSSGSDKIPDTK